MEFSYTMMSCMFALYDKRGVEKTFCEGTQLDEANQQKIKVALSKIV